MSARHRCVQWALYGAVLGLACLGSAWAQDPAAGAGAATAVADPTLDVLTRVGTSLGLPGVLAWIGWQLGRAGALTVRIELGPDSKEFVKDEISRLVDKKR